MNRQQVILAGVLVILACAAVQAMDYRAVINAPPRVVPTSKMPDGPLLGNGDLGVVLAGPPEAQTFYLGKNDFWTSSPHGALVINVGRIQLNIPALKGASYRQEQDLARAEVRGAFAKDALTVRTLSWIAADENLLVTELQCDGGPVKVALQAVAREGAGVPSKVHDDGRPVNIGREGHGDGRWYFDGEISSVVVTKDVLAGKVTEQTTKPQFFDGKTTWRALDVPKVDKSVSVAAWIKIKGTPTEANYIVSKGEWNQAYSLGLSNGRLRWSINGVFVQSDEPLPSDKWLYVVGTFDGRKMCAYVNGQLKASLGGRTAAESCFSHKADKEPGGREVAVATRAIGADGLEFTLTPGKPIVVATAILSDLDAKDCLPAAKRLVAELTTEKLAAIAARHREWWTKFWARSLIEIPDKEIEKRWYAALYVMGCCSRPGKVAPGLWGNWLTTDCPAWHGDFHLNYNFQAPFYIVYASNHADLSLPFYDAMNQSIPRGRRIAAQRGWKGIHLPVSIGPWGLCPEGDGTDWGQRSNAAYSALNFIWYWQYTQDKEWLRTAGYPYLREVADFWEDYLKLEDGRYMIHNDSIHEGSGNDTNGVLSLGLVRALFKNMLAMSAELGVDAPRRAKWQDILERLSPFPTQQAGGKTVFRYTEKGMAWCDGNTLGIQHIYPAGAIGLDSDPKLLETSRNMIDAMRRWHDGNGFSSWYTACARVAYDPAAILKGLRAECDQCSMPNLLLSYGGGGIENVAGFLAVNEMLLQSHEGVLRFFPCWPKDQDARFGTLRAVGALLVSAEIKAGVVRGVKIASEKGKDCEIVNPWPGKKVTVVRNGKTAETVEGGRFTLKTSPGETIELEPRD